MTYNLYRRSNSLVWSRMRYVFLRGGGNLRIYGRM